MSVRFRLLGPIGVDVDGCPLVIASRKQRSILAVLLLNLGRVVPADNLVHVLWGEERAPARANATLQVHVSNLRKALAPASHRLGRQAIVGETAGYRLQVGVEGTDLGAFEAAISKGTAAMAAGHFEDAATALRAALELFHPPPLGDLGWESWARPAVARLEGLALAATENLMEAELARGRHGDIIGDLEAVVDANPLNERLRSQLMLALYRSGRQVEALAQYGRARHLLVEELGVEPGRALRNLEAQILRQDPALDLLDEVGDIPDAATVPRPTSDRPTLTWKDGHLVLGERTTTIGRRSDRDVAVSDPDASRLHAELRWDGDGYEIVDLGSTNGTLVNGQPVRGQRLRSGDVITIGGTQLRFRDPRSATAPRAHPAAGGSPSSGKV